jgi:hypothetical protein
MNLVSIFSSLAQSSSFTVHYFPSTNEIFSPIVLYSPPSLQSHNILDHIRYSLSAYHISILCLNSSLSFSDPFVSISQSYISIPFRFIIFSIKMCQIPISQSCLQSSSHVYQLTPALHYLSLSSPAYSQFINLHQPITPAYTLKPHCCLTMYFCALI